MALGAFLAGVLLAESEYRRELETDLEPFKGCCSACSSSPWAWASTSRWCASIRSSLPPSSSDCWP
ncbi:MAG: hypothetical protein U1F49_11490 [Rubrivivax sp.]